MCVHISMHACATNIYRHLTYTHIARMWFNYIVYTQLMDASAWCNVISAAMRIDNTVEGNRPLAGWCQDTRLSVFLVSLTHYIASVVSINNIYINASKSDTPPAKTTQIHTATGCLASIYNRTIYTI